MLTPLRFLIVGGLGVGDLDGLLQEFVLFIDLTYTKPVLLIFYET